MKKTRKSSDRGPRTLSLAELCEGIPDGEKELAAAWELGRERFGSLRSMSNRNKRGRRHRAVRVFAEGDQFFNQYALTFTVSQKWPKTPYADLTEDEKSEAFPNAPVFQQRLLKVFGSPSLSSPAEMITPQGQFKSPWNAALLGQLFGKKPGLVQTPYRLIKVDVTFPLEQIKPELVKLLKKHCPHERKRGGNQYATWLRNLGLYRAYRAGWPVKEMENCWKKALEGAKESENSEISKRSRFGPPKQKILQRIASIEELLGKVF